MTTKTTQILSAAVLGTIAFAQGIKCAPCLDSKLMNMLAGRQIGETPKGEASSIQLMTEWSKAWTCANLTA